MEHLPQGIRDALVSPGQKPDPAMPAAGYPIIMNGDHAEFEAEWAASGKPANERPDWPLPSFDAHDWAAAFCKIATGLGYRDAEGRPIDEGWMISWFANALMRGFDENASRQPPMDVRCERGCTLKKINAGLTGGPNVRS